LRVKTFYGWTEKRMDKKINEFLSNKSIEVVDIKFASPLLFFSAMIIYKGKYDG